MLVHHQAAVRGGDTRRPLYIGRHISRSSFGNNSISSFIPPFVLLILMLMADVYFLPFVAAIERGAEVDGVR